MKNATHCTVEITTYSNVTGALGSRREEWQLGSTVRCRPEVIVPGDGATGSIMASGNILGIPWATRRALGFKGIVGEGVRVAA